MITQNIMLIYLHSQLISFQSLVIDRNKRNKENRMSEILNID